MKKSLARATFAAATVVAALSAPSLAAAATPVLALGFEEGTGTVAGDSTNHNNDGTVSGATWTTSGKHGGGLVFDGVDDIVTVADAPQLRISGQLTMSGWVKLNGPSSTDYQPVVGKHDHWQLYAADWWTGAPSALFERNHYIATAPVLDEDTWTHVAATFSQSGGGVVYVDGDPVTTEYWSMEGSNGAAADVPVEIGANTFWGDYLNGVLDDVRVYNVALSEAEVEADMAAGV